MTSKYVYASILKDEMNGFLKMRKTQGFKDRNHFVLESLDKHLVSQNITSKNLSVKIIDSWLTYACNGQSASSMNKHIGNYNSFAKYLRIHDINVFIPEYARKHESYVPYIFSELEMENIFAAADNIKLSKFVIPQAQFAMLVRMLYGCGLRLGEALALKKSDIDIANGVLFIRNSKGNRDKLELVFNNRSKPNQKKHYISG